MPQCAVGLLSPGNGSIEHPMNIPERIAGLAQWINWRLTNEGRKLPIDAHRSRRSRTTPPPGPTLGPPKQPAGCWALSSPRAGLVGTILTAASLAARSCRGRSKCWHASPAMPNTRPTERGSRFGRGTLPKAFKKELLAPEARSNRLSKFIRRGVTSPSPASITRLAGGNRRLPRGD